MSPCPVRWMSSRSEPDAFAFEPSDIVAIAASDVDVIRASGASAIGASDVVVIEASDAFVIEEADVAAFGAKEFLREKADEDQRRPEESPVTPGLGDPSRGLLNATHGTKRTFTHH
jgi:hypothetical protein